MVLGPAEGGLSGQDAPDGCPAAGRNPYPSGANTLCCDVFMHLLWTILGHDISNNG